MNLKISDELYILLMRIAKFRGVRLNELLKQFIDECVDDNELMEINYTEYVKH